MGELVDVANRERVDGKAYWITFAGTCVRLNMTRILSQQDELPQRLDAGNQGQKKNPMVGLGSIPTLLAILH